MPGKPKARPAWDAASLRKVNPRAKIKNLPAGDQETLWLLMHPTDGDTPPYTLEEALVHLQEEHDITCVLSTLSEWHAWYSLRMRMEGAAARAQQATLEFAKDHPDAKAEDLERYGQLIFSAESLQKNDPKVFIALMKEQTKRMALELEVRRVALLEQKAKAADDAAAELKKLKDGGKLLPEQEREAILNKMDEILGLKN